MLLTIGAFVVVLGVLILVHELGHFLAARAVGVGVPRFSIGFGPPTPLSFRWGETEFVVSWVPFGGYVKMASREESEAFGSLEGGATDAAFPPERLFENKPLWARMTVILAGVTMNVIFAAVVYFAIGLGYGRQIDPNTVISRFRVDRLPPGAEELADVPFGTRIIRINGDTTDSYQAIFDALQDVSSRRLRIDFDHHDPAILPIDGLDAEQRVAILSAMEMYYPASIGSVQPGSAADRAGLQPGDLIVRAGGDSVLAYDRLVDRIRAAPDIPVPLDVMRNDTLLTLTVRPDAVERPDPVTGDPVTIGFLGITPATDARREHFGIAGGAAWGIGRVGRDARYVMAAVRGLVTARLSPRELGGPILIGQWAGQTARAGLEAFLRFLAFFSVNLAVLNLLPIPVLDGGQFVFLAIEGIRGRPLSLDMRLRLTQMGLLLLFGIMVLALTNDVLRLFTS